MKDYRNANELLNELTKDAPISSTMHDAIADMYFCYEATKKRKTHTSAELEALNMMIEMATELKAHLEATKEVSRL